MTTKLTKEQQDAIRGLVLGLDKCQVQTLGGLAGTGKTVCVAFLHELLKEFAVCAYTGKAANVLRRKNIPTASTIHSLIYKPVDENGKLRFVRRQKHELGYQGFLVDEASMVDDRIDGDLRSFGLPIVYVGDHGQLPPIGQDVCLMTQPDFRLERVHRNAGPIANFAQHLRRGQRAHTFPACEAVQVIEGASSELLLAVDVSICAFNRFRVATNDRVRRLLGRQERVEKGEKVICLQNNHQAGLVNGLVGVVKRVHKGNRFDLEVDGRQFRDVEYRPDQFGSEKKLEYRQGGPELFDYGYVLTCHKCQGDEWPEVLAYEQECEKWDHKRWAYTAASRAKGRLHWVTSVPRYIPKWL